MSSASESLPHTDSDDSYQSGDPRKYWWIGGDNPYRLPSEWEGAQSEPEEPPPTKDLPEMSAATSDQAIPRVLELESLTRDLTERLYEMEDAAQRRDAEIIRVRAMNEVLREGRDAELTRAHAFNDLLVERVAGLTVHSCTMWNDQVASRARANRAHLAVFIAIFAIVSTALVGKMFAS